MANRLGIVEFQTYTPFPHVVKDEYFPLNHSTGVEVNGLTGRERRVRTIRAGENKSLPIKFINPDGYAVPGEFDPGTGFLRPIR